jgi:hypothetical protein
MMEYISGVWGPAAGKGGPPRTRGAQADGVLERATRSAASRSISASTASSMDASVLWRHQEQFFLKYLDLSLFRS